MISKRYARRQDLGLTPAEFRTLARLDTPKKIQSFIDAIPQNFEVDGDSCMSVRSVLQQRRAHCIEGAFVAACALWINGEPPLLFDLKAERDYDHVVTLFRHGGRWGALSKTNHAVLRGRDPVYRDLRELAMSWFHEYSNRRWQKTLRSYSRAFDLRRVDPALWVTNPNHCWDLAVMLDGIRHYPLMAKRQEKQLRLRDTVERDAFKALQYPSPAQEN